MFLFIKLFRVLGPVYMEKVGPKTRGTHTPVLHINRALNPTKLNSSFATWPCSHIVAVWIDFAMNKMAVVP